MRFWWAQLGKGHIIATGRLVFAYLRTAALGILRIYSAYFISALGFEAGNVELTVKFAEHVGGHGVGPD